MPRVDEYATVTLASGDTLLGIDDTDGELKQFTPVGGGARVLRIGNQTIANNTPTMMSFGLSNYNTDAAYLDGAHPTRLVLPYDGTYLVMGHICWDTASASGVRTLEIVRNGTDVFARNNVGVTDQFVQTTVGASAGDYVELRVTQTSGVPLDVIFATYYTPVFIVHRLS